MVYGLALALVVLWLGTLRDNREPDAMWRSGGRRALLLGTVPGVAIGLLDVVREKRLVPRPQREPLLQLDRSDGDSRSCGRRADAATGRALASGALGAPSQLDSRWASVAGLVLAAALAVAQPLLRSDRDPELMLPRADIFVPLQRLAGVSPTDPERTFYEYAGHWIAWYHGWPAVVLALAGAALLLWRVVRGEARAAEGVLLIFALVPLALIIAKPSIYPDQPWAARRMVPFALPGALLLATAAVASGVERLRGRGRVLAPVAIAVGLLTLFVPTVMTTGRVARFQRLAGLQRPVNAVCAAVPTTRPSSCSPRPRSQTGFRA